MDTNLSSQMKSVSIKVNEEIHAYFSEHLKLAKDIDPVFVETLQHIEDFVLRGGKRARSFLTWCGYRLCMKENAHIYQVAAAVELHHFYLLTIDDMADRDTLRHGGPTLQEVYRQKFKGDEKQEHEHKSRFMGEISAALIENAAIELLTRSQFSAQAKQASLLHLLNIMTEQTAAGWLIHHAQNEQSIAETSEARFIKGLKHVTAFYTFVGPLFIGSTLAGASKEIQQVLEEYGNLVGTAFQIQDDILGLFGNPEETGKSDANDVREGKKTLLLQKAYKKCTVEERNFLEKVTGKFDLQRKEVDRVRAIVRNTGALDEVKKQANEMVIQGKTVLDKLPENCDKKFVQLLKDIADFIVERSN